MNRNQGQTTTLPTEAIPTHERVPARAYDQICPVCLGDGQYEVMALTPNDALEPNWEWEPCNTCKGTGFLGAPS